MSLDLLLGAAVVLGASTFFACSSQGDDCEANKSCGSSGGVGGAGAGGGTGGTGGVGGDGGGCDTSKSPSDEACLISEEFAVFVSPTGNDATGDGTKQKPYKTLSKAVSEGGAKSKSVYACDDGTGYTETSTLTIGASFDGLGLFGGFDCTSWSYSTSTKAKLAGAAIAVRIEEVPGGMRLEDFEITALDASGADANGNGNSSITLLVADSKNVQVKRATLTAGNGAPGETGTELATAAEKGIDGTKGSDACATPQGGASVTTSCSAQPTGSISGKGGDGAGSIAGNGQNGDNGQPLGVGGGAETGKLASP